MGHQRRLQRYVLLFLSPRTQMNKGGNRMKHVVFCTFVKIVNSCYQTIVHRDNSLSLQTSSGDF